MSAIQDEIVVPRLKALVVGDSKLAWFVFGRMLERQGFDLELPQRVLRSGRSRSGRPRRASGTTTGPGSAWRAQTFECD